MNAECTSAVNCGRGKGMDNMYERGTVQPNRNKVKILNMKFCFGVTTILVLVVLLTGCIGAGTHGSLKSYEFGVNKDSLSTSIVEIINSNPNIHVDTVGRMIIAPTDASGKLDTIYDHGYNDGERYVRIKVRTDRGWCDFTFCYSGTEAEWGSLPRSKFFICFAFNEVGEGGSEGYGGVDRKLLNYLTEVFERELVNKLDHQR